MDLKQHIENDTSLAEDLSGVIGGIEEMTTHSSSLPEACFYDGTRFRRCCRALFLLKSFW